MGRGCPGCRGRCLDAEPVRRRGPRRRSPVQSDRIDTPQWPAGHRRADRVPLPNLVSVQIPVQVGSRNEVSRASPAASIRFCDADRVKIAIPGHSLRHPYIR
jgi:hypothetical protein